MTDTMTLEAFQNARQKLEDAPCNSDMVYMPDGTIVTITPKQRRSAHADWLNRQIVKRLAERNIANGVGRDKIDFAPRFINVMRAE